MVEWNENAAAVDGIEIGIVKGNTCAALRGAKGCLVVQRAAAQEIALELQKS